MAYLPLSTANLPDPVIDPAQGASPEDHFNTVLYSGNGVNGRSVTGVGFQPDFTWVKVRNAAGRHVLGDVVRGDDAALFTDVTDAEATTGSRIITRISDGFTVSDGGNVNQSGETYVAWNWNGGGTGVTNTDGSITSTVSANTDAGISIVSYTGAGTNSSVGHGLNNALDMLIVKKRSGADPWATWHNGIAASSRLELNATSGELTNRVEWNSTAPDANVFYLGGTSGYVNGNGDTYVAYCFHSVEGFSKFGSYVGNGSTDGPFVYTGFRPAFVMVKNISASYSWSIWDSAREPENFVGARLYANDSGAEINAGAELVDFTSNGFKLRSTASSINGSGNTFIYMAFAEDGGPFKYSLAR